MTQYYGPTPSVAAPQPLYARFVHGGETVDFTPDNTTDYGGGAGLGVPFGAVLVVGAMIGIALRYIAPLQKGALAIEGTFEFPKTNPDATLTQGVDAYWDATNNVITSTKANPNGTANTYAGKVETAAANTDTTVRVSVESVANASFGKIPVTTVAAAGSTLADAAQLGIGLNIVTGADGTKGVKLPAAPSPGTMVYVKGTTSATLKVYPDAAATINAIAANGPISLTTVVPAIFVASSATQWYTIPLVPS